MGKKSEEFGDGSVETMIGDWISRELDRSRIGLSDSERMEFEHNGFVILRGVVSPRLCSLIESLARTHLAYEVPPIETEYEYIGLDREEYRRTVRRLRQVYDRDRVFRRWMEAPLLRPALTQVLSEAPVLVLAHHNSIMTKMPGSSTATEWHQDIRYWSYDSDNLVSVWLALGEEHSRNGVLEFIPGSHRERFAAEAFDERKFFRSDYPPNRPWIDSKTSSVLQAGDVVLFHAKLLHRANANRSDRPKISFVYTVRGTSVRPIPESRSARFAEVPLPVETGEEILQGR